MSFQPHISREIKIQVIAKVCMYVSIEASKCSVNVPRVSSPCGMDDVFLVVYSCSNRSRRSSCLFVVNVDPVSTRVCLACR